MPRWILVILAGAIAIGSVVGISRNYACAALPACLLVMLAVALLDRSLFGIIAPKSARRDGARLLIALTAGLVVALIPPFRLTPTSAFRFVFGITPPPGVTNVKAESRYAGGPGDSVILLSFDASQSAIDELIARLGAKLDVQHTHVWNEAAGRDWSRFVTDPHGKRLDHSACGPWISRCPAMIDPRFFAWSESPCCNSANIIWDAESGDAIVLFVRG